MSVGEGRRNRERSAEKGEGRRHSLGVAGEWREEEDTSRNRRDEGGRRRTRKEEGAHSGASKRSLVKALLYSFQAAEGDRVSSEVVSGLSELHFEQFSRPYNVLSRA